jgi:hypothetical protein
MCTALLAAWYQGAKTVLCCAVLCCVYSGLDHAAIKALKLRGIQVKLVDGNPASKKILTSKAAGLGNADAVVLCGMGGQPAAEADVQVGP